MPFESIREGFVARCSATPGRRAIAVGPRSATLPNGDLLCSSIFTAALGTNDFLPVLFRSTDGGDSWVEQGPVWPHLAERWSFFVSISRGARGRLFLFGSRTPIERVGESFWSEATQGLKPNELVWAQSLDGGHTWTEPAVIPMPIPGAAEAPGALCVTRAGRWLAPYSPYPTFDPNLRVERNQVVAVWSEDEGRTWKHTSMLRFDAQSGAAEAWLVELADGRLLGTAWHLNHGAGGDRPNAFALSLDGGLTWQPTQSTGILGQSTALAALPDGRALFIYNQRRHGEPGVWLAVANPTETAFGIEANEIIWRAQTRTQHGSSGEHAQWEDFSFGEPSITVLPDGTFLVTLWCIQPSGSGVRYVRLKRFR
jgi:BNR repeat protein